MEESFLIPANSKKSMLILGLFNVVDLVIFGAGCLTSFFLIAIISASTIKGAIMILAPSLICAFLIVPIPNQHNVRTLIKNIYLFFTNRRTYYWKGWCIGYENEKSNKI